MKEDKYYANERRDIIALIPPDAKRVLDVGCGFGFMGKKLKQERGIEVVGVESDEKASNTAKANVDKLIKGNVEDLKLPFKEGYFDCIVYGDVLNCLKNPWKVLKEHTYFLRKGGCCIASIPNVAHYSVIKGLLKNRWEYVPSGLLDDDFLRFFTLEGVKKMFENAGYNFQEKKRYVRASKSKKLLNKILGGRTEYLLTEQYIVTGKLG